MTNLIDSLSLVDISWIIIVLSNIIILLMFFLIKKKWKRIFLILLSNVFIVGYFIPNSPWTTNSNLESSFVKSAVFKGVTKILEEDVTNYYDLNGKMPANKEELYQNINEKSKNIEIDKDSGEIIPWRPNPVAVKQIIINNEGLHIIFNSRVKDNAILIKKPVILDGAIVSWDCFTKKINNHPMVPKRYLPKECKYM